MSYNPFDGPFVPYGYDLTLLDREADFLDLDSKCSGPRILNYRYISPRGTGKTTLLETYFSFEKCQELAQKYRQLVCICCFSGDEMRTDADVFVRLIDAVKQSLENLDMDSPEHTKLSEQLRQKQEEKPDYRTDPNKGEELLKEMLSCLRNRRYYVTLVLDEFHQLACAKHLADSTFSKMAAISQEKRISYIVASDYDDDVGTETYYMSPFTRIFTSSPTHLSGIHTWAGKKALMELIRSKLTRYPQVVFTDEELRCLIDLTDGIPGLLKAALKDLFEIKQEESSELNDQQLTQYALSACTPLMAKWVQYFDDARWETMAAVIEEVTEAAIKERLAHSDDKRTSLTHAGLIEKDVRLQKYRTICPLFELYVRSELPRRRKTEVPAVQQEPRVIENHYHIEKIERMVQGDDHSQNLVAQNVQIQHGLTASDVLQLLGDGSEDSRKLFAGRLSEQLKKCLPERGVQLPARSEFEAEEAYDQSCDLVFDSYGKKLLQDVEVDEEKDLIITPAELKTLDDRFAEARTRCRSTLTDTILAQQSERCQFYLRLSVVVEDALNLPGIQMEDYSPQLILYGKALEQSLRDNFYELFHKEPVLSVYNTRTRSVDHYSSDVFANKLPRDTMIGNYAHLMIGQKEHLANLCQTNRVQVSDQPADINGWRNWWIELRNHISKACEIRNLAGHAGAVSPAREKLDEMCDVMIGTATQTGILSRTVVGNQLHLRLFPPAITHAVVQKFVGTTCPMVCDTVKTNGGIKGFTCDGNYAVNISPRRARMFREANGCQNVDLTGKTLMVKILEFQTQDEKEFFGADIVSANLGS